MADKKHEGFNEILLLLNTIMDHLEPIDDQTLAICYPPRTLFSLDEDTIYSFTRGIPARCALNKKGTFWVIPANSDHIEEWSLEKLYETYAISDIQAYLETMLGKILGSRLVEGKINIVKT